MRGKLFTLITGRRRILLGAVALAAGTALAGVALAADSGAPTGSDETYVPELGVTLPSDKAALLERTLAPSVPESGQQGGSESSAPPPTPTSPDAIPAKMLDADTPVPMSPEVLDPTNAWLVSDGQTLVAVYAGADGQDKSTGRFVIIRQDFKAGVQTQDVVDMPGTGPIEITSAPLGADVETSAQADSLGFDGQNGDQGSLQLVDDTVSGDVTAAPSAASGK